MCDCGGPLAVVQRDPQHGIVMIVVSIVQCLSAQAVRVYRRSVCGNNTAYAWKWSKLFFD